MRRAAGTRFYTSCEPRCSRWVTPTGGLDAVVLNGHELGRANRIRRARERERQRQQQRLRDFLAGM